MSQIEWDYEHPLYCDTFWGSHGCDLEPGHEEPCRCIWREYDDDGEVIYEEPGDGPCGPPYQGTKTWFHSNHNTPTPPQTLRAAGL